MKKLKNYANGRKLTVSENISESQNCRVKSIVVNSDVYNSDLAYQNSIDNALKRLL